ncbi:ribonuclease H-like domain-containing protein [Tanacetum coccineum]
MLAKSSAEAEYRAKNTVTCEVIWIHKILTELNVQISLHVPIHCDNSFAIQIAANPVLHEKTKHFEIEFYEAYAITGAEKLSFFSPFRGKRIIYDEEDELQENDSEFLQSGTVQY